MEARAYRGDLDAQTLEAAACEQGFACLDDETVCETAVFMNRDVEVVRCYSKTPCLKRQGYDGMQICSCPVKKALHGL